jgi:uncharacterized protein YjbJ (UPF0337 family)
MWSEITGNWKQLSERARQRVQSWTVEEWKLIRGKQDELVSKMRQKYGGHRRYGGRKTAADEPSTIEKDQG